MSTTKVSSFEAPPPQGGATAPKIVVIGSKNSWLADGRELPEIENMVFASIGELTRDYLAQVCPDIVLSTLIADDFDALDLAARLAALEFRGRYRALTVALPAPDAIRDEILSHAGEVDFEFLVIDGL